MRLFNLNQVCTMRTIIDEYNADFEHITKPTKPGFFARLRGEKPQPQDHYEYYKNGLSGQILGYEPDMIIDSDKIDDFVKSHNSYVDPSDKNVYYKPHIFMRFSNGNTRNKYFDTVEDMTSYITSTQNKYPNIQIL